MLRGLRTRLLPLIGGLFIGHGAVASDRFELLMADVSVNGGHPQPSFVLRDTAGAYWIEEALADAHDLARRLHLRTEERIDTGELDKGKDRFLDRDMLGNNLLVYAKFFQRFARHKPCGDLGQWSTGCLGHKR